jgi:hypothetical protein
MDFLFVENKNLSLKPENESIYDFHQLRHTQIDSAFSFFSNINEK